ncbi:hypothetical protein [Streptomyces xiamenensis]|uniref:hypothetical protein n=1 Tax=Streptomyces xiamenensis TaxID=408015 RepID=UPI003D7184AC
MIDAIGRHPAVQALARHYEYGHLREDLQPVSRLFHDLAAELVQLVPDDPELTAAMRHLLEAKDAAVRAAVVAAE